MNLHRSPSWIALAAGLACAASALAADLPNLPNGRYTVRSVFSGQCLAVESGATAAGAALVQWTCDPDNAPDNARQFDLAQTSAGVYRLKNVNSGKVMDVTAVSTRNGATVQQWDDFGNGNQRFGLDDVGDGSFYLRFRHSGKCLNVVNFNKAPGARMEQWACNGGETQRWTLVPAPGSFRYEAEDAFWSGGVVREGSYLRNFASTGARVIFTVNAAAAGPATVGLRYAQGGSSARSLNVYVNGLASGAIALPASGGDTAWRTQASTLTLRAGLNTIAYQLDAGTTGGVNIDALQVDGGLALAARGATLAYQEYEAEAGSTNARVPAASIAYQTAEAESSGRRHVSLEATGHYVQWVAQKAANALVVRYSLPDAAQGGGTTASLGLYVNGVRVRSLGLNSRYAWTYGAYPFHDDPSQGGAHHFFDESRFTGLDIPKGATVRLQKDAGDTAAYYKVDLVDLEMADAPYARPAHFISVTDFGAVANDGVDDRQAFINAVASAQATHQGLWIPAGSFTLSDRINLSGVQVRGAGMWHTVLQGVNGKGGFYAVGSNVTIADLSVVGDALSRRDGEDHAGFEGNFGTGSLIQNVWVEHTKVGVWPVGGTDGLFVVNGRIRDTWADGVNFWAGVQNTTMSQFNVRNTGDDAMAMCSCGGLDVNDSFRFNTVQVPVLANAFALYGGKDNKLLDNIGADTVSAAAGVAISTRREFNSLPFSGTTEVRRTTLNRTGGWEPNWNASFGALWIFADHVNIDAPIVVDTLDITGSSYEGVLVSDGATVSSLSLNQVKVQDAGTAGLRFRNVSGTGSFSKVTVSGSKGVALDNPGNAFDIVKGAGNSGW